jgi:hypothetical protein
MNYTIDHAIVSSFKEYLDHKIAEKLSACKNVTVPLFLDSTDDRMAGYKKVGAGPQQWLYDSSVSGATIASPSGFATSGWQTAKTDFRNSRFIVPLSTSGTAPPSGTFAVKHFNSYVSTKDDEELFQNTVFDFAPEMNVPASATKADSYYSPCYFLKVSNTRNDGFEMGGVDKTSFNLKVTCFVKTEGELLALASVFRDLKNTNTMVLNDTPLDAYNDLKSRPWNFHNEMTNAEISGKPVIFVEEAYFGPLKIDNAISKFKNTYIGLGNFTIFVTRLSRQ